MRYIIKKEEWDNYYYHGKQQDAQIKIEDESLEEETKKVNYCLDQLKKNGFINDVNYNREKFLEFREKVHKNFFIYWTAINPPMEHLLFALSEILKPKIILGIGIFTGNPVVWSMGPALEGLYEFESLAAVEINKKHAKICNDNFMKIAGEGVVKIHARDGFKVIQEYEDNSIDLLYLDANGKDPYAKGFLNKRKNTKRINYSLLKDATPKIKSRGFAMCHNAYMKSFKRDANDYLELTNNEEFYEKTATIGIDEMGLEFSIKK